MKLKGMTNILLVIIIFIGIAGLYMLGALNGLIAGLNPYLPPGMQIPTPAPILPPAAPPGELGPGGAGFTTLLNCQLMCTGSDYDAGACLWPSEALATYANIGSCTIAGNRHCGTGGMCWCYCWNEAAVEPEPEPEPEGGGIMTWAECEAMGAAEGKDFYHLFETAGSLDACEAWASSYCASRGTWLTMFDWNLGCCIWNCEGL